MTAQGAIRKQSGRTDWRTPRSLFALLDTEFGFTVDGAADSENALCEQFYSNAFNEHPTDEVIYCNPPYGRDISSWVSLFQRWQALGNTVVALLPAATDTRWFLDVCNQANEVRLLIGRVQFWHPDEEGDRNGGGSLVAIYRAHPTWLPARIIPWRWSQ